MILSLTRAASTKTLDVTLSFEEGEGVALGITVSTTKLGSNLVQWAGTTVLVHLRKVESTVHSARKLGEIDGESKLLTGQLEHVVLLAVLVQEVGTRADGGQVGISQHVEVEGASLSLDTKSGIVGNGETLNQAVLSAGLLVGADGCVWRSTPNTTAELWGILLELAVHVLVEHDVGGLSLAAILLGALVGGESRVLFAGTSGSLSSDESSAQEHGNKKRECLNHFEYFFEIDAREALDDAIVLTAIEKELRAPLKYFSTQTRVAPPRPVVIPNFPMF